MHSQNMQPYEKGRIAVDAVIFTIDEEKLLVSLNTRDKEPFSGMLELPGGLLLAHETAEETLMRKLSDITPANEVFFEQFYTFTKPDRDPRVRTVSIGYIALLSKDKVASTQGFYQVDSLPKLAFDHREIILKSNTYLQEHLNDRFVKQFLPQYFPLNDLQMIYEVICKKKIDNRNFRKKMVDSGIVKKVKKVQTNVSHRPASLYQFSV